MNLRHNREDAPRHISVWMDLDIQSPRESETAESSSVRPLTRAIPSTSSVNNLTFCRSGPQVVVKELILATTATEVLTAPCIGSIADGASFMWSSASFAPAT